MFPSNIYNINNNDLTFSPFSYNYNTNSFMPFSINDLFLQNDPFEPSIFQLNPQNPEISFFQTQNANQEQVLRSIPKSDSGCGGGNMENKTRGGGKKDRHSKIKTVNGFRDRRMRLSLEAARKFFGLQDRLGYDKPSKTVEWLLRQAEPAIKKISITHRTEISTVETSRTKTSTSSSTVEEKWNKSNAKDARDERKKKKSSGNYRFRTLSKETRLRARERAKERTREKRMKEFGESNATNNDLSYLCSSSSNRVSFETGEESRTQNFHNLSLQEIEEASQNNNYQQDESLEVINKWSPLTILNHPTSSLEHQYEELQSLLGRPNWEIYNTNQNFF